MDPWNRNARLRHEQILAGKDVSFSRVLKPETERLVSQAMLPSKFSILEVGCGTGIMAKSLADGALRYVGFDSANEAIAIATEYNQDVPNIRLICDRLESVTAAELGKFDIVVASMVFQALPSLSDACTRISSFLHLSGCLVISIPHPWFWPVYKRSAFGSNFRYHSSETYTLPFTITNDQQPLPSETPYFHRPLHEYVNTLRSSGFIVETLTEPFPSEELMAEYGTPWTFPRFLFFLCRKVSEL